MQIETRRESMSQNSVELRLSGWSFIINCQHSLSLALIVSIERQQKTKQVLINAELHRTTHRVVSTINKRVWKLLKFKITKPKRIKFFHYGKAKLEWIKLSCYVEEIWRFNSLISRLCNNERVKNWKKGLKIYTSTENPTLFERVNSFIQFFISIWLHFKRGVLFQFEIFHQSSFGSSANARDWRAHHTLVL